MTRSVPVLSCPKLDAQPRTEAQARKELLRMWVNLYRSPEGFVSANAHLSEVDALDDISSPAEGWAYQSTIIKNGAHLSERDLSQEAADHARRATAEFFAEQRNNDKLASAQAMGR